MGTRKNFFKIYRQFGHRHKVSVVLYGCEVWFLTVQEENRLRVSENRVLRKHVNQRGRK